MPDALIWPGLLLLGVAVAAYGTLIGAGGGFLLTPILLILYPDRAPEMITAIALCAVFFNAASGSVAYVRQKRVDFLAAATFAATEVPGAIVGALTTGLFPRAIFEFAFGLLLVGVAFLLLRPGRTGVVTTARPRLALRRLHTDARGDTYSYAFNPVHAGLFGLAIGFVSSTFGVGGGFIYVPVMILLMRFPAYIATATSTFTLMFAAAAATSVHAAGGNYAESVPETAMLTAGVVIGAQVGALVSARLGSQSQQLVSRLLSVALVIVGIRLLAGVVM